MNVSCPACHAELTLDVLIPLEEARVAFGRLLEQHMGLGGVSMRYIGLFRPEKRRMSMDRMARLVAELLPDIERRAITRKGREWSAPPELWRAGMEAVLTKRDKGTLTLPLTSHGLLYEVMCSLADKAEAAGEREREDERRARGAMPPRDLSSFAEAIGEASMKPAPATLPAAPAALLQLSIDRYYAEQRQARKQPEQPAEGDPS